jgi:ATP phosphoribosyltransferase regulatory subunit HisZ
MLVLTLKNAMNMGQHIVNEHLGERLLLDMEWTAAYQHFDGMLRHLDRRGIQIYRMAYLGFYDTFLAVQAYAQEHHFGDLWKVEDMES